MTTILHTKSEPSWMIASTWYHDSTSMFSPEDQVADKAAFCRSLSYLDLCKQALSVYYDEATQQAIKLGDYENAFSGPSVSRT
jgi:hypothetical protein